MSENPETQEKVVAMPRREIRVVQDDTNQGYLFDTARFEHAARIAEAMAFSNLIPKHLRESKEEVYDINTIKANCFMIVNQAIRWGFDPFALLKESYVVGGNLGWQGKLIAAVINARAGLKGRLKYTFTGKPGTPEFEVTVTGTFKGEDEPCTVTLTVAQAKTSNDIWTKDPEQKLCYSGAIKWARRHCPEIVLGVLSDDDVEKIAATQPPVKLKDRTIKKPVFEPVVEPAIEQEKEPDIKPDAKFDPLAELNVYDRLYQVLENYKIAPEQLLHMLKRLNLIAADIEVLHELSETNAERFATNINDILIRFERLTE